MMLFLEEGDSQKSLHIFSINIIVTSLALINHSKFINSKHWLQGWWRNKCKILQLQSKITYVVFLHWKLKAWACRGYPGNVWCIFGNTSVDFLTGSQSCTITPFVWGLEVLSQPQAPPIFNPQLFLSFSFFLHRGDYLKGPTPGLVWWVSAGSYRSSLPSPDVLRWLKVCRLTFLTGMWCKAEWKDLHDWDNYRGVGQFTNYYIFMIYDYDYEKYFNKTSCSIS